MEVSSMLLLYVCFKYILVTMQISRVYADVISKQPADYTEYNNLEFSYGFDVFR